MSGQPRDAKKVSVTGAHGRLRELFSSWPLGRGGGDGKGLDGRLLDLAQLQINIENVTKKTKKKTKKQKKILLLFGYTVVLTLL